MLRAHDHPGQGFPRPAFYLKSSGGQLGIALKMAGVDGLIIKGRRDSEHALDDPSDSAVGLYQAIVGKGRP